MTAPLQDTSALAYRWRDGDLHAIAHPHELLLDDLHGIDRQKAALEANTRQFVAGLPANHALLTGARGTGKSSLVKALLPRFADAGLRLIAVTPHDLVALPEIVAPLRERSERYLVYVDDFSVAPGDRALTELKTALDGGIEEPAANVLIYATSNRRHLMPEYHSENAEYRWSDGELQPGESSEEKISLSERFGLWLSFPPFDQQQYLEMVERHLQALGGTMDETARETALRWALQRASRSGRVAAQFARDWVGRQRLDEGRAGATK